MESAIGHAIDRVKSGTFSAEEYHHWTMMAKGGASLAPYYEFENRMPVATVKSEIAALSEDIKSGKFVVEIIDTEPKSTF